MTLSPLRAEDLVPSERKISVEGGTELGVPISERSCKHHDCGGCHSDGTVTADGTHAAGLEQLVIRHMGIGGLVSWHQSNYVLNRQTYLSSLTSINIVSQVARVSLAALAERAFVSYTTDLSRAPSTRQGYVNGVAVAQGVTTPFAQILDLSAIPSLSALEAAVQIPGDPQGPQLNSAAYFSPLLSTLKTNFASEGAEALQAAGLSPDPAPLELFGLTIRRRTKTIIRAIAYGLGGLAVTLVAIWSTPGAILPILLANFFAGFDSRRVDGHSAACRLCSTRCASCPGSSPAGTPLACRR